MLPSVPRPDTLKGVDDLIRSSLEAFAADWFWRLIGFTLLVAIGLLFEFPEIWHQTISSLKEIFHGSKEERKLTPWAHLLGTLGWPLIIGGVVGEGMSEGFLFKADSLVLKFDEILLRDAQHNASAANERASAAYERAAETEREAALENARAANAERQASEENARAAKALESAEIARKAAEGFQLQISQANERAARAEQNAAEANRIAEAERLARVKIEERLAGWKLNPEAQIRLMEKLKAYPNTPFDLAVNPVEARFMENLDAILFLAGWKRGEPKSVSSKSGILELSLLIDGKAAMTTGVGRIEIHIAPRSWERFKPAAEALSKALNAEGISAICIAFLDTDPSEIHIMIGAKE